ncbi:MAG: hypothetical protein ACREO3_02965 [Arenimonas sp.]
MEAPILWWMQPPAATRAEIAQVLRGSRTSRWLLLSWVATMAGLAWGLATGAFAGLAWPMRLLVTLMGFYALSGMVMVMFAILPLTQVRLDAARIAAGTGAHWQLLPLAEVASYRLVPGSGWRVLEVHRVVGTVLNYAVPMRIAPDSIHRYFAERGIAEADVGG